MKLTARERDIVDEHVGDFRKDNDREPSPAELVDLFLDRAREEDGATAVEFRTLAAKYRGAPGWETCHVCGRSTERPKRHPCRFEVACSCWRGIPCDGSGRIGRR